MNKTSNEKINEVIELMKMFDVHIKEFEGKMQKNILEKVGIFQNVAFERNYAMSCTLNY